MHTPRIRRARVRRGLVVVAGAGFGIGEDAAVVDATGEDRDPTLHALGQQLFEGDLVQQRIAAREQEAIEIAFARKSCKHLGLIHARADRSDHAIGAESIEGAVGTIDRVLVVVVGVMYVQDVDAAETKPLEALFE